MWIYNDDKQSLVNSEKYDCICVQKLEPYNEDGDRVHGDNDYSVCAIDKNAKERVMLIAPGSRKHAENQLAIVRNGLQQGSVTIRVYDEDPDFRAE